MPFRLPHTGVKLLSGVESTMPDDDDIGPRNPKYIHKNIHKFIHKNTEYTGDR